MDLVRRLHERSSYSYVLVVGGWNDGAEVRREYEPLEDIIEALQTEPISVLVQNFSHQVDQHVGATTRCAYDSLEEIVEQWSKALQDSMFFLDCKGRLQEGLPNGSQVLI